MVHKNRWKKKEVMPSRKRKEEKDRRLSLKEKNRTAKDVSLWVSQTQPSRKTEFVPVPVKDLPPAPSEESVRSEELIEEPVKVNGGYGWVIVAFSFFLHFIADGLTFSFGSVFNDIVKKFNVNRFIAGLIGSFFLAAPLGLSPLASVISAKHGIRKQLIWGLSGATVGIVFSGIGFYVGNIAIFSSGFSFFLPLGLALIYNGAIVAINLFFAEPKAGFATGLAVCGTGTGTIMFPILRIFFDYLHPGNATLYTILMAFFLCITALTICYLWIRDPDWTSDGIEYKKRLFEKNLRKLNREVNDEDYEIEENPKDLRRCQSLPNVNAIADIRGSIIDLGTSLQSIRESASMTKQLEPPPPRSRSVGTFMKRNLAAVPEFTMVNADDFNHLDHLDLHLGHSPCNTVHASRRRMLSKNSMSLDFLQDQDELSDSRKFFSDSEDDDDESEARSDSNFSEDGESPESDLSDKVLEKEESTVPATESTKKETSKIMRPSVTMAQTPGRVMVASAAYRIKTNTNMLAYQAKMASAPLVCPPRKRWHEGNACGAVLEGFCELRKQFSFFRKACMVDAALLLFTISVTSLYSVLDVPYVSFYDHVVDTLLLSVIEGSLLTTVIGGCSLVSTLVISVLSHHWKRFQRWKFYFNGVAMLILAGATYYAAVVVEYRNICVVCAVLGTFLSSNYVLQSVMCNHLYQDTTHFTATYGMISMCQGIAAMIAPPVIGYIRDLTGEYTTVYHISSGILVISGLTSIAAGLCDTYGKRGDLHNNRSPTSQRSPSKISRNGNDVPLLEAAV